MTPREQRTYLETRLRNLKRSHAKLIQHSDLKEEAQQVQEYIKDTTRKLDELTQD